MRIATAEDAAALLAPYFASAQVERLAVVHLGADQRVLGVTVEEPGTADAVELPVRPILAAALRMGAHAIIVGHNHPSGDPSPSEADLAATRRLAAAAAALNLRLVDHLIFAGQDRTSLAALGLL